MDKRIKIEIGRDTPGDRLREWERTIEENLLNVQCRDAHENLRVSIDGRRIDNGVITHSRYSPQTLVRQPYLIKKIDVEHVTIATVRGGAQYVRQGGQVATLGGGTVSVIEVSRPFEAVTLSSDMIETYALTVPRTSLAQRVGAIETLVLGPHAPLQELMASLLRGVANCIDKIDAETANRLVEQTLDLTALAIGGFKGRQIEPSTHRAGTLLRLKAFVRARLRDEDLTIERAANALGISSRYVNALLAMEGTSFGRYLLSERLDGARRELMDPRLIHRQITEVAFGWGFKNASHFSSAFKDKFGMSPRDAKPRSRGT